MLPLLETCQIRLQDVSLRFSKALKLYGALRDCKPNMMESKEVTLPHRAGHRGSRTCLLVAGGHQPNLCCIWKVQKYILHMQASMGCQLKASGEGSRGGCEIKDRLVWAASTHRCPRTHEALPRENQDPHNEPFWGLGRTAGDTPE